MARGDREEGEQREGRPSRPKWKVSLYVRDLRNFSARARNKELGKRLGYHAGTGLPQAGLTGAETFNAIVQASPRRATVVRRWWLVTVIRNGRTGQHDGDVRTATG